MGAGYLARAVQLQKVDYRIGDLLGEDFPQAEKREISFGWDCRLSEPRMLDVKIIVGLSPTEAIPELVSIDLVGRFEMVGDNQSLGLQAFARFSATATLIPFARELIASLTMRGMYGGAALPIMNVVHLMADWPWEKSHAARQIMEDPEMAQRFGVAEMVAD